MVAGTRTFSIQETLLDPPAINPPPVRHALFVCLIALAALLHLGTIGWGALYGETEGQYAGAAREMVQTHAWLTPTNDGIPRLQKPPLLYWLIAVSFKVFGINAGAARLPIALAAIVSVALTFLLGERLVDYWRGFVAGLIYLCFWGLFLLGRMIMPEPVFSTFIIGSIYCAVRGYQARGRQSGWFLGVWICAALACLTKGIHGLIFPAAVLFVLALFLREARIRFRGLLRWRYLAVFLLIVLPWHIWAAWRFPGFLRQLVAVEWLGHISGDPASLDNEIGVPRLQFLALHLAWWFPVSLAVIPGAIIAWRKILRPREIEFADAVPLCWATVIFVPLLLLGQRQDYYSFSMWSAVSLFAASAWSRMSRGLRLFGICSIAFVGLVAIVLAIFLPEIVNGAANQWKDISVRVTAWQTVKTIPGATWLAFRPLLALSGATILVGAAFAFYLAIKDRARLAIVLLLATTIALGLSSIEGVSRVAPFFSLADAATYLNQRLGDTGEVYYEGPLHTGSSLVFYLNRRFFLVNQRPDPFAQSIGALQSQATEEDLLARWSTTEPIFLIIEESRVPHWQRLITERVHIYHQVATCGTSVVLSNQL